MDVIEMLRERIREEKNKKERAIVFWYDSSDKETAVSLQEPFANEKVSASELTFYKILVTIS